MKSLKVLLATPRGFCAGVDRAVLVVDRALELFGRPVYVRGQIVHNRHVVANLARHGALFVSDLDQVPDGGTVIFSAHGVAPDVRAKAIARRLNWIDATCPLVSKVHQEVRRFSKDDRPIVLIGENGHDEVIGTMGEAPGRVHLVSNSEEAAAVQFAHAEAPAVLTQTTLSIDDTKEIIDKLKGRFPTLLLPPHEDICFAMQNRQKAVRRISVEADLIIILGSRNSHNANQLKQVAESTGVRTYLIDDVTELNYEWLQATRCIGISAGASTPESLVEELVNYLGSVTEIQVKLVEGTSERMVFALPAQLMGQHRSFSAKI